MKGKDAETRRHGDAENAKRGFFFFLRSLHLPLSAKILLWFFMNVAVLATVIVILFNAQFQLQLDWVFATNASQRADTLRSLIVGELNTAPPDDWDDVLERYGDAYKVRLSLFEPNGKHLIGSISDLPPEVRERMPAAFQPPPAASQKPGVRSNTVSTGRVFLRTNHPVQYWLVQRARLDNPRTGGPMRVLIAARADSFSMGGLILDPAPWVALILGTVAFSVLFWFPLLRGITRSIGQMMQTTRQIAEGRFDTRISTRRRDELGTLAESINQMAARLDGFVKGQKRFLGDIAHELCSPLARLQMVLGIMEQRAGEGKQGDYVQAASEKAQQIAELVNELLTFSRASFGTSAIQTTAVSIVEVVQETLRRDASDLVKIKTDIPDGLHVMADRGLLARALSNLIRNAIRYGGNSASIEITATLENETIAIRVADSGPGVPEEELPKLFDAFYRLDSARTRETGGVGLGLTIVKTCVESCGGSVVTRNRIPHGLEVEIRLPAGESVT